MNLTTRCSFISSATTAPALKAACKAVSITRAPYRGVPEPIDYQLSRLDPDWRSASVRARQRRLGVGRQCTVPVDQDGGLAPWRHPHPMVITWPHHIEDAGDCAASSVTSMILCRLFEAAQIEMPTVVDGVRQAPLNGASLVYLRRRQCA